ncbi:NUDIX hydrolase [Amycolatopsis sp. FBCC-B4732]|uniref:NUDIX hydrolase n=1 Tax=Amycolatopsis sp. FBCC-B4732 TaxID=3079339 RepID=UPI001FF10155|nr:NUDIX hydrolase [Amycolatopsis sp. FBCC-B4732]UOX90407.1 NUDIX hydrolase [Amycolatopsis sp. FBCC-B4732]
MMSVPDDFVEQIIEEEVTYRGDTISVRRLDVETAPGVLNKFEVVEKGGDSVAILPINTQDDNIYLIKEYYPAADARLYSLPKGTIERGETSEAAAQREMQEEVGLSGRLVPLATFHVSPGYLRQRTFVFLAFDLKEAEAVGDERTFIAPIRLKFDDALEMVKSGEITEARLVAALLMAKSHVAEKNRT